MATIAEGEHLGNVSSTVCVIYIVITCDGCIHFHGAFIRFPLLPLRISTVAVSSTPTANFLCSVGPITATKAIPGPLNLINRRLCSIAHAQQMPLRPLPVGQASAASRKVSGPESGPPMLIVAAFLLFAGTSLYDNHTSLLTQLPL